MEYTATNLKAGSFTFPVLEVFLPDPELIESEVAAKIGQAPDFFVNTPIIIDFQRLDQVSQDLDLDKLVTLLRSQKLNPVAVRGGDPRINELASCCELAVLADERRRTESVAGSEDETAGSADSAESQEVEEVEEAEEADVAQSIVVENRVHLRPVRSGQKLASSTGDLTVIASASAGSELIAAGSIHVYGALRGRAIAGVAGDETCRIFCQRLDAELVSIAGTYRISEDIDERYRGKSVQIFLVDQRLEIRLLSDIL